MLLIFGSSTKSASDNKPPTPDNASPILILVKSSIYCEPPNAFKFAPVPAVNSVFKKLLRGLPVVVKRPVALAICSAVGFIEWDILTTAFRKAAVSANNAVFKPNDAAFSNNKSGFLS